MKQIALSRLPELLEAMAAPGRRDRSQPVCPVGAGQRTGPH